MSQVRAISHLSFPHDGILSPSLPTLRSKQAKVGWYCDGQSFLYAAGPAGRRPAQPLFAHTQHAVKKRHGLTVICKVYLCQRVARLSPGLPITSASALSAEPCIDAQSHLDRTTVYRPLSLAPPSSSSHPSHSPLSRVLRSPALQLYVLSYFSIP